jgi:gliding motility-associated-like protein
VPYSVRVLSTPDVDKRDPRDTATQLTIVQSGNQYRDQARLNWSKTQEATFSYDKPGIYYITALGVDNIDAGNASCPIISVPDTFGGNEPPIRVYVVAPPEVKIQTSKQRMCVGDIFKIRNKSNFDSINRFTFDIWDSAYTRKIDSLLKTSYLGDSSFQYRFTERGTYNIVGSSSRFIRSLGLTSPEAIASCERSDTVTVFTTSTKADFRIDTTATKGIFSFVNLSDTALSDVYTWWVLAPDGSLKSPLKDTNRKIWENPKVFYRADKPNIDLLNLDFADDIGTFTICLKASTTDPTCPDSICKTIYNNVEFKIKIPNVFTPGTDGTNDDFKVDIQGYDKYEMVIYNRWGTKVFESTDPNMKWNGKSFNDGAECAEGVYYYVLNYRFRGRSEQQARGSITLIR